ncbi:MAG: 4Fe-4S binding protein [Dehalococcoidia bacterium]|nr:MAG: 4Fe-4S binding protein [Dehalococcoidia bacterium]
MHTRDCGHICGESSQGIGEAGRTGEWRSARPVVDNNVCTPAKKNKPACFLCWLYCPDAVISKGIPIEINLEYCKGCGICLQVCPVGAITMVNEEEFA